MLYRVGLVCCLTVALLLPALAGADRYSLFSGTVAELDEKRVTVQRKAAGSPDEKRTFLITDSTKVEGELRPTARVTIGFVSSDQGDVAARIIVRPPNPKKN